MIIVIRFFLKGKISLRLQYGLWALVLVRLLIPFSIGETVISIGNWLEHISDTKEVQQITDFTQAELPSMSYEAAYEKVAEKYAKQGIEIETIPQEEFAETIDYEIMETMTKDGISLEEMAEFIWLAGMLIWGMGFVYSNVHFTGKLKANRKLLVKESHQLFSKEVVVKKGGKLPVYISDRVDTPCLYGLFRPAIYVTEEAMMNDAALRHVVEHERTHYIHRDYIWSVFRALCLILHWYNPLVWCAAVLSKNDAELACDEAAILRLGEKERAAYGRTLIGLTCEKKSTMLLTATTMTSSGKSIKERIMLIAKRPKMAVVTLVFVLLLAGIVAVCTFTGAVSDDKEVSSTEEVGDTTTPSDEVFQVKKKILFETTADLNHDGVEDLVQSVLIANSESLEEGLNDNQNCAVVQVFIGYDEGGYSNEPIYQSAEIGIAHSINGQIVLTEKDGRDYIVFTNLYEGMVGASYSYTVLDLSDGIVVVDTDSVTFENDPWSSRWEINPHREDVVPDFKEKLEPWIENGILLVSCDVDLGTAYCEGERIVSPGSVFDLVWARTDITDDIEMGPVDYNDWKQKSWEEIVTLYQRYPSVQRIEQKFNSAYTDLSSWFTAYNGEQLQIELGSEDEASGVTTRHEIIFYQTAEEDEQKVLKAILESLLDTLMIESENRPYTITKYELAEEQPLKRINENVWMLDMISGYYSYEGTDMVTMEEAMIYASDVKNGMIPFQAQGSSANFQYFLIKHGDVYRFEKAEHMGLGVEY